MLPFKKIWFQLHWFIGITAGTVLIVIGLSGALLSFHEELLEVFNPGTASVAVRDSDMLGPQQLVDAVRAAGHAGRIQRITLFSEAGRSAQIGFAPPPGERRGETVRVDPYTGTVLPEQRGAEFFEWTERLHRWLLLPRDDGRPVTGGLAAGLLFLALSGLYLRWPRRPLAWRTWFTFDTALRGRSFLWGLHSVAGTWALVAYVVFTLTGLYWAFDAIRTPVDRWGGAPPRAVAAAPAAKPPGGAAPAARGEGMARENGGRAARAAAAPPVDIAPAWEVFRRTAGDWQLAQLRLPERAGQPVQITWLGSDAAHERARNRLNLQPDGAVVLDERYADLPQGRRALGAIYPLHMGTYFGLPGRIAMTLAALMLPLFAVTGWMLYLDRRRKARAVRAERAALAADAPAHPVDGQATADALLVAFASQSGRAERLAVRTVAALRAAGSLATLLPVARLDAEQLRHHRRVLLVASTFGDGDPPDVARRFVRTLAQAAGAALPHLRYGLLALGDRQYAAFCGFGHTLDHQLRRLGAQPMFPLIEMDGENPAAWAAWQAALRAHLGVAWADGAETLAADTAAAFGDWRLAGRALCNPGSVGAPLFGIELVPPAGMDARWRSGALVEVMPRHAPGVIESLLRRHGWEGATTVDWRGASSTLADALATSALPAPGAFADGLAPQAVADALQPLSPRSYSVASLCDENDGLLRLLVRQERHDGGLGLASGWLTAHAALGGSIALRLVDNGAFALADGDAPAIFIGNGSGYAGLRGHLRERIRTGRHRNWLLFGERQRAHDGFCEQEAAAWQAAGTLARADFVYSRDQPERIYVQDALRAAADEVRLWVGEGAVLYVCGSLDGMAAGVDAALADILGIAALDDLIAEGRYRRDVY